MAVNTIWRVIYGFKANNKSSHDAPTAVYVLAADNKEDTIRAVLVANGIVRPGATIEIHSSSWAGEPGVLS